MFRDNAYKHQETGIFLLVRNHFFC